MTVKDLCDLLAQTNGQLPVFARCKWHGEAPADDQFEIAFVTEELEPDTGDGVVMIECQQDG